METLLPEMKNYMEYKSLLMLVKVDSKLGVVFVKPCTFAMLPPSIRLL